MTISEKAWVKYITRLSAISKTAARRFTAYLNDPKHNVTSKAGRKAATDYAAALAEAYGESAAAVACEMYDAVAAASKASVPAALTAPTPTYGEVAKTVNGMLKRNYENDAIGSAVGRLIKRTEADTTLQNALRDGAEFAWVPHGDTCPFCITLASNGWQRASKKAIKGGHAEHIHANCDCTYAIRFDGESGVKGYDPDYYKNIYNNAEGNTWQEKLRSMERDNREAHKDEINARKRAVYREKKYGIISVEVDKITPCLIDNRTGEVLSTTAVRVTDYSGLSKYTKKAGWFINWREMAKQKNVEVYQLILDKDRSVQGLLAITPERGFVHLNWAVSNPLSQAAVVGYKNKQYDGIGGHLFAIAAQRSKDLGCGGYLSGFAANQRVENYYCKEFGAEHVGILHPYHFEIGEAAAANLLKEYTFSIG